METVWLQEMETKFRDPTAACTGTDDDALLKVDTQLVSQDAFDCYTIAQYRQIQDTPRQKSHGATGTLLHGQYPNPRHSSLPRRRNGVLLPSQNLRIPIMFSDGYDYIQSVRTNNIGMFFLTVGGGGSDTKTQRRVAWRSRVRFYDY